MTPIGKDSQGWVVIVIVCLLMLGGTLLVQAQSIPPLPTPSDIPSSEAADPDPTIKEPTATSTPTNISAEPTATAFPTAQPNAPTAQWTITPTPTHTATDTPLLIQTLGGENITGMSQESSGLLSVIAQDITFPTAQLTGSDVLIDGTTTAWVAEDSTGLGEGWHLTVSATDFVDGSHIIPKEGLAMRLMNADIEVILGNTKPTVAYPFTDFTSIGTTQPFASAGANEGMGSYSLQPTFRLSVPAETHAGTYLSNVTITIIAGPGS